MALEGTDTRLVGGAWASRTDQRTDRSHLEHSQERMTSRLKAPPPILRRVRCVPAYDVVRGDTYLQNPQSDRQDAKR